MQAVRAAKNIDRSSLITVELPPSKATLLERTCRKLLSTQTHISCGRASQIHYPLWERSLRSYKLIFSIFSVLSNVQILESNWGCCITNKLILPILYHTSAEETVVRGFLWIWSISLKETKSCQLESHDVGFLIKPKLCDILTHQALVIININHGCITFRCPTLSTTVVTVIGLSQPHWWWRRVIPLGGLPQSGH